MLRCDYKVVTGRHMYNKLFTKILDSSIWLAPDPHRLVWITIIAAMDQDGNAMFACPENLALRARVSLKHCEAALKAFEGPDPRSGDPENDGMRIERIPGGWHVLNAHKYRAIVTKNISREQTRLRTSAWRQRRRDASVTQCDENVTPSDSVSDAVSDSDSKKPTARKSAPIEFEELKSCYPLRSGDQGWQKSIRACNARLAEGHSWIDMLAGTRRYAEFCRVTGKIGTEFVKQAATFFGPDKHFMAEWPLPKNKAEVVRDQNIDASREWLAQQEQADAIR